MTFTWPPQSVTESVEPRVRTAKFGDGYEQRAADGINAVLPIWELSFSVTTATAGAILDYLLARGGVESFLWTPPGGTQRRVVCRKWRTRCADRVSRQIDATFEQVPL